MGKKLNSNISIIKTVNIPRKYEIALGYVLQDQVVQYEFGFCEDCPEQLVKNLLANESKLVENRNQYANSPTYPRVIPTRACRDLPNRAGRS